MTPFHDLILVLYQLNLLLHQLTLLIALFWQ